MRGQSSSPIARALSVRCCRSWPSSSRRWYSAFSARCCACSTPRCCSLASIPFIIASSRSVLAPRAVQTTVSAAALSAAAFSRSAVATAMRSPATSPCSSSAARLAAASPMAAAATAASYSAFCARTAASSSSAASARRSAASFAAAASSALRLVQLRSAVILSSCSAIASKAGRPSCSCAHHASIPAERGGGSATRQSEPSRIAGRLPLSSERMISGSCIGLL
mmetsp:Transcript_26857/g.78214  ORF Transcript_26857/g.78214 Transcript_26857/m.78214 type:complete len:224 (-) Transcript_26857:1283-1954(-)